MALRKVFAFFLVASTSLVAHDPITTKVTWQRDIAPIVRARCVSCHSPGGRAPMSLASYDEARPWARAIREEVLARRMPKWHAVRGYGDFVNDPSLSAFEIALITAWVDGGAPELAKTPVPGAAAAGGNTSIVLAPAGGLDTPPATAALPPDAKTIVLSCTSQRLPRGRLLAVLPILDAGGSLRLTLHYPDGTAEPLVWVRNFEPAFPQTYRLRTPLSIPRGTRLVVEPPAPSSCRLSATHTAK